FAMEKSLPIAKEWRPIVPLEILTHFEELKNKNCIHYTINFRDGLEHCALPWTRAPIFLKAAYSNTPIDADLTNPQPEDDVLPNAQLWTQSGFQFRLSEDKRRTDDTFVPLTRLNYDLCIYDGINKNNKALCACKCKPDNPDASYSLCMFIQSDDFGKTTNHHNFEPFVKGKGTLRSLMIEDEYDRFMYSVDNGNSLYTLIREDLMQSDESLPREYCCNRIILITKELFTKTVCLGKDSYFGITNTGKLYSIRVNNEGNLSCVEQTFPTLHTFKDISVDNTVSNEDGFKQKIAFLTDLGEIYITHLDAYDQPTLFYTTTIKNPK